jgi:hypothetical protein
MSKLHELKAKIASLPDKERRKNIVVHLARYNQLVSAAYDTLAKVSRSQSYAQTVFPDGDFQRVAEQGRKASSAARRLRRKLSENIDAVETKSSDAQFIAIGDYAKTSQSALKDRWSQLLTRKVGDFENLVRAAEGANLTGSRVLTHTLGRLREQSGAPPKGMEAARRTAADIRTLEESVNTLGLTGRSGEFLVAAAAGRGNPRDLCDPEVSEFIERYSLWGLLSVKLG